ncbi:Nramp family divalent metal transporter [Azospirillum picis]|uniref:Manganese transport protein n=1 Tax=Azospirillum picis TaxID=488438 RepID=A0ABU0MTB6_9PROT|nr:Nramp family divalent metal transporter [Azospirillum picis]MBP2302975.1 manganese transport protein [Azospirillum picis]MDQ0536727.1 manganese transport protein [Azospirillum picis]
MTTVSTIADTDRRPAAAPARRFWTMLGPGFVVAVGYMDPGNWATDIAAGSSFGFALLSAVLIASLAGIFLQALIVRLTLATGKDLARLIRDRFPRPVAMLVWAVSELAMIATDLAELLGSAIALKLLFGMPIVAGVLVSAVLTFGILALPGARGRAPELVVGALMSVVVVCFGWELVVAGPDPAALLAGLVPSIEIARDPEMLYLSLGIIGATVMPHNLFLHSGLVRSRLAGVHGDEERRQAARWLTIDLSTALALAGLVNGSILAVAAVAFQGTSAGAAPGIEDAHALLGGRIGGAAALVFAIALLAAGQSSTTTGTMAGQIVTEGFLNLRMRPLTRALITRGASLVPALVILGGSGDAGVDELLVLSQVVLALTLPFILIPMLLLLKNRKLMGGLAMAPLTLRLASLMVLTLTGLSGWLAGTSAMV